MCLDCGCQEGNEKKFFHTHDHDNNEHTHSHTHPHPHGSEHSHDHTHEHTHDHEGSRVVTLEQNILAKNDEFAAKNKNFLKDKGIITVNIISSPGSGKTTLLEKTLERLKGKVNCSVIVGDQSTDNDAKRLEDKCDNVHQIETHSSCHINAEQVSEALSLVIKDNTQILFIENVGNLICPAAFELGEDFKIALLSTTEGEDKPIKYPVLFSDARIAVLTKTDLIPHLDWDLKKCRQYMREINPGMFIFELSAKTGEGMDAWVDYLETLIA
ncbi:MAG TPA: hydrogenase nickel incorporation protein HypB [Victivallales bacterium]|nr:hydrogenase nickel incorporation protein HypB [Victivallales bacterium]